MRRSRRVLRWMGSGVVVLLLAFVLVLAGFRVAAARRETLSRHDAAPRTGRFVPAADVELFVQEEGPAGGAPVVFVHGTGAWSEIWRGTLHALAGAGYRAIALDMPPFGYSSRPATADYSDDAQARRILGALDALHLERATLVGHSFGGRPTMQATFLAPQRVDRLVLVDAALDLTRGCAGEDARGCAVALRTSFPPRETTGSWPVRAVLGTPPLRDAVVATTLSNPSMTGWLLSKLVSNREAAVTSARVAMLQRPFVVDGWASASGSHRSPRRARRRWRRTARAMPRSRCRRWCSGARATH